MHRRKRLLLLPTLVPPGLVVVWYALPHPPRRAAASALSRIGDAWTEFRNPAALASCQVILKARALPELCRVLFNPNETAHAD